MTLPWDADRVPSADGPCASAHTGRVSALSIQPLRAVPHPVDSVRAVAGLGLEGDRHASRISARQVLIASSRAYEALSLAPMALRQNVLVDVDVRGLRSGDRLRIGPDVVLVVMFACEPCGRLDRIRARLSRDIGTDRGMLARVALGGTLRQGDTVSLWRAPRALWSDVWSERVVQVLRIVPSKHWVTFGLLAELSGIAPAYCRAFPKLLASLPEELRRRARASGRAAEHGPPWDGAGLHEQWVARNLLHPNLSSDSMPTAPLTA